jgi:hypothetical protein
LANFIKTPQFEKPIFYDWEHPNFNAAKDPFIKNFDDNGNFIKQETPQVNEESDVFEYFRSSVNVIYDFIGKK